MDIVSYILTVYLNKEILVKETFETFETCQLAGHEYIINAGKNSYAECRKIITKQEIEK